MDRRRFLAGLAALSAISPKLSLAQDRVPVLSRFPYLQNTATDRSSILWATEDPDDGVAEYSEDGVNFNVVEATSRTFPFAETSPLRSFTQYQANLNGLRPNTRYFYRVSAAQQILALGSFRTAGPGPFTFLAFGDSGQRTDAQFLIAFRLAVENPAFMLHVGDIAYMNGTHNDFQRGHFDVYNRFLSALPYFPIPGNHEYETRQAAPYLAVHSVPTEGVPAIDRGRYYSFDWGNAHFVCLDSNASLDRALRGEGDMLKWLERDLRATRQFWRVAMIHHPPYAGGQNVRQIQQSWSRNYVAPILEKYGVQLVLSGDEHSYQRSHHLRNGSAVSPNTGTLYITTGGAGASLYNLTNIPQVAFARSAHHYLRVQVDGVSMGLSAVNADGAAIDGVTLNPLPVPGNDPAKPPVTTTPLGPGSLVRIQGRSLAAEERFSGVAAGVPEMAQTSAMIDGKPLSLFYVSATQIWGRTSTPVQPPFVLRLTNPNGSTETLIQG